MRPLPQRTSVLLVLLISLVGLASASAQDAPSRVLFTNVNVFDGVTDGLQEGMSVLIEGNLIAEISSGSISAEGATVIDGGGRTLMPRTELPGGTILGFFEDPEGNAIGLVEEAA